MPIDSIGAAAGGIIGLAKHTATTQSVGNADDTVAVEIIRRSNADDAVGSNKGARAGVESWWNLRKRSSALQAENGYIGLPKISSDGIAGFKKA